MDVKIVDSFKNLENIKIDAIKFQKMMFLYNALDDGWCIKRMSDSYIFTKKHENKKEVLLDSYLTKFMTSNLDINKIFE
jgi:hypothetical protein